MIQKRYGSRYELGHPNTLYARSDGSISISVLPRAVADGVVSVSVRVRPVADVTSRIAPASPRLPASLTCSAARALPTSRRPQPALAPPD